MEEETIIVDVPEIISFFDEIPCYSEKQATSVVSVVGEDLGAGCLQKYLEEEEGASVSVLTDSVTPGTRDGQRLDRWIVVDWPDKGHQVFQTEIKNWSAHAIGGKKISRKASAEELRKYKHERWREQWDSDNQSLKDPGVSKVFNKMKLPDRLSGAPVLPLVIYWMPIASESEPDRHLFQVSTNPTCRFRELWVFSISSYLRSIREPEICLKMPIATKRLRILNRLFRLPT